MVSKQTFTRAAALLAVGVLASGLTACGKGGKAAKSGQQPLTASSAPVELKVLNGGTTVSGPLVSREEAAVTTQLSGYRVAEVLSDVDAYVKAGQPMVRLDDTLLKSQIEQAKAQVAQAEAAADRADREAARTQGLEGQGVLSQEQIDQRRLAARSGRASLAAAKAQLADLEVREGLMTVRAPVSGRVLDRAVRPGDVAGPSAVMFRICRNGEVELNADAAETVVSQVRAGDHADVELANGAHAQGVVRYVSPEIDQASKLGHIRISLPSSATLRPGGFARARFTQNSRPTPVAPESAVRFDADGASVMVVGPDHHVHRVMVRTGERAQGFVALIEGPPVGSQVLLGGSAFVLDGDLVNTAPAGR